MFLRKKINDRLNINEKKESILKFNMLLGLKALKPFLYVEAILEKLKLIKDVFLWEIEEGVESFIPKELSQDHMPSSFRYYDPIIAIISENIS